MVRQKEKNILHKPKAMTDIPKTTYEVAGTITVDP